MDIREQFDRCWAGTRFLLLGETEEAFPILEEKIFHRLYCAEGRADLCASEGSC